MDVNTFVGAWRLSSSVQAKNDCLSKTFGDPPSGQIQYTKDGRMSAFLMNPCWVDVGDNAVKQADLFFSYAGHWECKDNEIHHTIEFCSVPSKVGVTFIRKVRFISDDEIELTTEPEVTPSGNVYQATLIWKRH